MIDFTLKKGRFYLKRELTYRLPWDHHQYVRIPERYETNFASIPWFLRWVVNPIDPHLVMAAVVHDWLVQEHGTRAQFPPVLYVEDITGENVFIERVDWSQAATIFRKIAKYEGASPLKRFAVYQAVRLNGVYKKFKGEL